MIIRYDDGEVAILHPPFRCRQQEKCGNVNTVYAIYDGQCVICRQSRRMIEALDWRQRVQFVDLHQWEQVELLVPSLTTERAMGQMHVLAADGLYGGFAATRRALKELPLGYGLWLLLHVPGMFWLGERVYRFIARHRYRINHWVGAPVCEDGVCKI